MSRAITVLSLTALAGASGSWLERSQDPRCTCIVEVPAPAEPNKAILELLQKQLDRCGPEHLTCPACPACPSQMMHAACPELPHGTVGTLYGLLGLMVGLLLGRVSVCLTSYPEQTVPARTRSPRPHLGSSRCRAEKHGGSGGGRDEAGAELQGQADGSLPPPEERVESSRSARSTSPDGHQGRAEVSTECRHTLAPASTAKEAHGSGAYRGDDVETEEDLGIIDVGDDEWLEAHDVIREHSAVTIFNHTDSTWYVSSKHPNIVRPLHGKHRHTRRQQPSQHLASSSDVGVYSERLVPSPSVLKCAGRAPLVKSFSSLTSRRHSDPDVDGVLLNGPGTAANHMPVQPQQRLQRRPHSAPNPAYGRTSAQDFRGDDAGDDAQNLWRETDSHLRCSSADRAVNLSPSEVEAARTPLASIAGFGSRGSPYANSETESCEMLLQKGLPGGSQAMSGESESAPQATQRRSRQQSPASPPIFEDQPFLQDKDDWR